MKAIGMRWNNDDGAWTLQWQQGREREAHSAVEKVFAEIANDIRKSRGMEAFEMVGVSIRQDSGPAPAF